MSYQVKSCTIKAGKIKYTPGSFLPDDLLSPEEIAKLLDRGDIIALEEAMPTSAAETQRESMTKTPWIYDPEDLEGYDLDTLNALIVEADSTVEPYETLEEAIAHLSMDHAEWQRLSGD